MISYSPYGSPPRGTDHRGLQITFCNTCRTSFQDFARVYSIQPEHRRKKFRLARVRQRYFFSLFYGLLPSEARWSPLSLPRCMPSSSTLSGELPGANLLSPYFVPYASQPYTLNQTSLLFSSVIIPCDKARQELSLSRLSRRTIIFLYKWSLQAKPISG